MSREPRASKRASAHCTNCVPMKPALSWANIYLVSKTQSSYSSCKDTACILSDWAVFASNCSMLLAHDSLNSLNPTLNVFSFPSYNLTVALKTSCQIFALELLLSIMIEVCATWPHGLLLVLLPSFGGPFLLVVFEEGYIGIPENIHFFVLLFCLILNLIDTDF